MAAKQLLCGMLDHKEVRGIRPRIDHLKFASRYLITALTRCVHNENGHWYL
jgi:hypothetical protein